MQDMREALCHPYFVEVLDAVSCRPMTVAEITAATPARRRAAVAALRIAAAYRLVEGDAGGSWDDISNTATVYRITDRGTKLVETLLDLSAWAEMFGGGDA